MLSQCGKLEISLTEDKAFAESSLPFDTSLSRHYQSWSKSRRWLAKKGGLLQTFCSPLHDVSAAHKGNMIFQDVNVEDCYSTKVLYLSSTFLQPAQPFEMLQGHSFHLSHIESFWSPPTKLGNTFWYDLQMWLMMLWASCQPNTLMLPEVLEPKSCRCFFSPCIMNINYSSTLLPHVTPHMLLLGSPSISLPELDRLEQSRNWLASYKIYQNIA